MTPAKSKGYCGAKKPKGGTCRNRKGFRTDHPDSGRCYLHGGASRNGTIAAARAQIYDMASEADAEPFEVITKAIRLDWGAVQFIREHLATIDVYEEGLDTEERLARLKLTEIWTAHYKDWVDQAVKHSKTALDAGVAERVVRIEEQRGELLAQVIRKILDGLGLTPAQQAKAPQLVRGALLALEA